MSTAAERLTAEQARDQERTAALAAVVAAHEAYAGEGTDGLGVLPPAARKRRRRAERATLELAMHRARAVGVPGRTLSGILEITEGRVCQLAAAGRAHAA